MEPFDCQDCNKKIASVLIIEDDDSIRTLLETVLQVEGLHAHSASNGKLGWDLLTKACQVNMVLLDLMMPVMDGWEFLRKKQKDPRFNSIPVVVMTAVYPTPNADDLPDNAVHVMGKPLDVNAVRSLLHEHATATRAE